MPQHDLVLLVTLGVLHGGARSPLAVVEAARGAAVPGWSPTSEVISGTLERALAEGLVAWRDTGRDVVLTASGGCRLRALIEQPLATPAAPPASVLAALKLTFLDVLEPARRAPVVDDLSRGWRQAADRLARAPARAGWWIEHEIARCRWEARWLETRPQRDPARAPR